MEQEKNRNNVKYIISITIIFVILLSLVFLLVTGNFSFKSNEGSSDFDQEKDNNTINDDDTNFFDYKNVPIEDGFVEIELTEEEKKKIDQELTSELWPGETSSLLSSVNFKEINKNYYENDCNKEYFSWWYIFKNKKVEQKYSHLLIEHYYEKYDATISMIKYDDFINITQKMFNVTKIECDNSNLYETTTIDNQKYVINSLAGGGGVCWGIKVLNKYQKDNVYYYLIHYHRGNYSLCGCDCSNVNNEQLLSKDSRFFKFKYGVRDDGSKYIISLEYLN